MNFDPQKHIFAIPSIEHDARANQSHCATLQIAGLAQTIDIPIASETNVVPRKLQGWSAE